MAQTSSLEAFRAKHGQLAYNALMKASGQMGGKTKPISTNSGLSQAARNIMNPLNQAVQNSAGKKIARVRGSADVPLTDEGAAQADERGQQFSARGGLDQLVTSPLQRARNTAVAISRYGGTPIHVDDRAMPWKLGIFEGEPVDDVKHMIGKLAVDHPNDKIPGRSAYSTTDGESFNDFTKRFLGGLMAPLMEAHAQDPRGKIGVVSHLRDVLAAKSWINNGARRDLQFDHHDINYETMTSAEDKPASVHRIYPDGDKWKMEDEDMEDQKPLLPGIYMIRHGKTAWNADPNTGETS